MSTWTTWSVWRQPRRLLAVLVAVEGGALAAPILMWSPPARADLKLALLLVSLSMTYSLLVAGWEKARLYLLFERAPLMAANMLAPWCFAAAIMLPPNLAAGVTLIASVGDWPSYSGGPRVLHRFVYGIASATLAAAVASRMLRTGLPLPAGLAVAALSWSLVGIGTIALALLAAGQAGGLRAMLGGRTFSVELLTMGVALAEYGLQTARLPLLWLSVPVTVLIQRHFTRVELRQLDRPDRLMRQEAWVHVATVVIDASDTASILRIDSPDPVAARTIAQMQAGCDAIGSYGSGHGLAILLPDCPPPHADALARRLRSAMRVRRVPCQIAAAAKPRDGERLGDLLAVSEAELVARAASSESVSSS